MLLPLNTPSITRLPLLSPFVGSKGSKKYRAIHDGGDYDCIYEAFTGGGGFTLLHPNAPRALFGADADPAVRAAWLAMHDDKTRTIAADRIAWWTQQFQGVSLEQAQRSWRVLREEFNWGGHPATRGKTRLAYYAAASIVIRRLCFGTVLRTANQPSTTFHGKKLHRLNIALSYKAEKGKSKLESFQGWQHQWPTPLDHCTITTHFNTSAIALKHSHYQSAIAVIDPPYWVPYEPGTNRRGTGAMTAAYPGHKPSDDREFGLCIDAINAAFATGKVKRAVVFNYVSGRLDQAIRIAAKRWNMPCHFSNLGPLGNMNNAQQKHGRFDEGVWELGDRRCFADAVQESLPIAAGEQLSLLDVA